jgi:phosphoribosylformimino-5-aminoimidazole carboxamide ribotide isomerase
MIKKPPKGGFFIPPNNRLTMIIIPAIDLKDGRCVRLRQGQMDSSTIFGENPAEIARRWESAGASRMHVVDLDGSIEGKPANLQRIREIVAAVAIPVQLGGGIRDRNTIEVYLELGIATVILGTVAAREPERVKGLIKEFPGKIAVGIDAKDGLVAVQGWTEGTALRAPELANFFADCPPAAFIYTDIEKDGMMAGPNISATRDFARSTSVPVILSGGVTTLEDVRNIAPLESDGVIGMIVGRALYEGTIDLKDAINLVGK